MSLLGKYYLFMPPAFFIFTASSLGKIVLVVTRSSQKQRRFSGLITKSDKVSRSEGPASQSENYKKETKSKKMIQNKKEEVNMSLSEDYKHRRGKNNNSSIATLDKVKGSDAGRARPSASIAAHAVDELIEANETEDRFEAVEGTAAYENGVIDNKASSSYMLPPPLPPRIVLNAYIQVLEANERKVGKVRFKPINNGSPDVEIKDLNCFLSTKVVKRKKQRELESCSNGVQIAKRVEEDRYLDDRSYHDRLEGYGIVEKGDGYDSNSQP